MATNFTSAIGVTTLGTAEVDKLTAAIDKQSDALASLGKKSENIKTPRWETFAASAKDFIQNPLQSAGNAAEQFLLKLGPLGAGVGVAAAGFGILAQKGFEWERQLGELGDRIGDISVRTGLSTKEVGEFSFAMKRAGGDIAGVEGVMRKLSQGLADGGEEGKKSAAGLRELGIQTRDVEGNLKPMSNILLQLSERLGGMQNAAERNSAAVKVLGRGALESLPDLLELSAGVKRAKELGLAPSDEDVRRWDGYQKQIVEVDAQWEKLTRDLKEPIVGTVSFLLKLLPGGNVETLKYNVPFLGQLLGAKDLINASQEARPESPYSYGVSESLSSHRSEVATNQAAARALGIFNSAGLAGAQAEVERLKTKLDEARSKASQLAESGAVLPEVAAAARREVEGLTVAYQKATDRAKELTQNEEYRANLKKNIEAFNLFDAGGSNKTQSRADRIAGLTSPFGALGQGYDLEAILKRETAMREALESFATYEAGGVAKGQSGAERISQLINPFGILGQGYGLEDRLKKEQDLKEFTVQSLRAEHDATARIVELRAGPGGEFATARQVANVRLDAINQELAITGDLNKARLEAQQVELDRAVKIEEIRRQGLERIRNVGSGLFDAALGGKQGLQRFGLDAILGQGRTIAGNVAAEVFGKSSFNAGLPGKIFEGTLLGRDPLKGATDANTIATIENTRALAAMSIRAGGGAGGYGFSSAASTFANLGLPAGASAADLYGLPLNHPAGYNNPALTPGVAFNTSPGASGLGTSRFTLGRGVGLGAAALTGGFGIYEGIHQGGLAGGLTAAGSGLAATGAILSLVLPKVLSAAGPIGIAAGLGLGLLTSFLPDHRKERSDYFAQQDRARAYAGGVGQDYSVDTSGRNVDYDYRGTPRPIVNNYYTSISAVDTQSFGDAIRRNSLDVVSTVADEVSGGNGEDLVGHLQNRLGF